MANRFAQNITSSKLFTKNQSCYVYDAGNLDLNETCDLCERNILGWDEGHYQNHVDFAVICEDCYTILPFTTDKELNKHYRKG